MNEAAFRAVAEDVSGEELDWFFDQWLHTMKQLDYAVADADTRRLAQGGWQTQVVVERRGEAVMPVVVEAGDARARIDGRADREELVLVTEERPARVVLDPDLVLLDVDRSNNEAAPRGG